MSEHNIPPNREVHPVDLYVGNRLKIRRNLLGISQEELGKKIGVTFQQIQKYERGSNRASASRLYEISRILNVEIGFFFEGFDASQLDFSGDQYDPMTSEEAMTLVTYFNRIKDKETRDLMLTLLSKATQF